MLSHHKQDRGTLSYVDFSDLKFNPKRMYYITGAPIGEVRGKHGHYKDQQYFVCVQGKIKVVMISKSGRKEKVLNPGEHVFLDNMTWGEQEYLTGNDILLVLCSTRFDKSDYIYDINEILK